MRETKPQKTKIRVATYRKGQEPRKENTMNTIVASSKSAVRFTLNFFDKTITGTKASFNKANKGFGPEYEELTSKMAAHPDFTLVVKEQKTKTTKAKRTYEGMDYKFMEDYIATFEDASLMKKYEAVKKMADDCGTKAYPLTKKWFLGEFSDMEGGFDMEAAKKDIANYRIAKAQASILEVVSAAAATAQNENEAA